MVCGTQTIGEEEMPSRKKKGARMLQFLFLFFGLSVAFVGWFLDHGEDFRWVRRVFASRYDPASSAYSKLLTDGSLTAQDRGFTDLLDVVVDRALVPVVRIENLAPVVALDSQGLRQGRSLRFVLEDERQIDRVVDAGWLELRLREEYLNRPLLGWSQLLMLCGLAITFGTGLYAILRQQA